LLGEQQELEQYRDLRRELLPWTIEATANFVALRADTRIPVAGGEVLTRR
jgi:hypothetical protein